METKKLKLDTKIMTIRGEQATEILDNNIIQLNIKECLMSLLPSAEVKDEGKKSITIWDLSIKIKNCKEPEIKLSDEEFGFVRDVVGKNFRMRMPDGSIMPYYPPFVTAQILKELNSKLR